MKCFRFVLMVQKVKYYFQKGIWLKELEELSTSKSFLIKQIRIIVLAVRGFNEDKCMLRASSLTFYSLLSFVPVIAMAFGIAKGFGMEQKIDELLMERMSGHEEIMTNVIEFSHKMLDNTKGGLIAGVGVVVLFWSIIKVMGNIEKSFNAIWGITQERTLIRKFSEYLTIMFVAPILLVVASSATVFVSSAVGDLMAMMGLDYIGGGVQLLLKLLPYGIIWILLTFIYMVMPNTNVKWKSAVFAAIVAGTIFEVVQWGYVSFQVGVAGYNAIYGSFAALPLFLAWLQLSWLIILFGGELSFAHQNVGQYCLEEESKNISGTYRKTLTLYVLHYIIRQFTNGKEAPDFDSILKQTKLPYRLLQSVLSTLEEANIISALTSEEYQVRRYQPAVDTDLLTVDYVLKAIENLGTDEEIKTPNSKVYSIIEGMLLDNKSELLKKL
ncbi:MAG: YihY/virulence factor BrkB family protein [Flavobacteriales bacterium]|nr:YihY/virulence factor BrkB family protein [Flavobacteriales bacterium]